MLPPLFLAGKSGPTTRSFRIAEDVSVLRVNYRAIQIILPGVWEITPRYSAGAETCQTRMRDPSKGD